MFLDASCSFPSAAVLDLLVPVNPGGLDQGSPAGAGAGPGIGVCAVLYLYILSTGLRMPVFIFKQRVITPPLPQCCVPVAQRSGH